MMKNLFLLIVFVSSFLQNVNSVKFRQNAELHTFNTAVNSEITKKLQDEAVIITLEKILPVPEELEKPHTLFGFDVFNFVPQSFSVDVDYSKRELSMNVTSTIATYSTVMSLSTSNETIESLKLKLSDEDDTIFVQINCGSTGSVVTNINMIKFFRSVAQHKFKVLFNRYYEMKVYTSGDNMDAQIFGGCGRNETVEQSSTQPGIDLDRISALLLQYVHHFNAFLSGNRNDSDMATEIFIRAFLTRDVLHQSSNMYRTIHLLQSITQNVSSVFHPALESLLHKIFWTEGREHHFVRNDEALYADNSRIKKYILQALFSNSPATFKDYLREFTDIGSKFRKVFMNSDVSINEVMRNDTNLVSTLLDIVFEKELPQEEMKFLNSPPVVKKIFAYFFMRDLNVNPKLLNDIHKRFVFNADKTDYVTIGKFIRFIFFKPSSMESLDKFIESDMVIGMRVVYILSSGQATNKDIYWTLRNLMTKKDIELPQSLEYPTDQILRTLSKCYINSKSSRGIFMQTLENIVIFNFHDLGRMLDSEHGQYIYNLYRDLILNDISKENSVLKKVLYKNSALIHDFIALCIRSVVANVDYDEVIAKITISYVKNTMVYGGLQIDATLTDKDYIKIFKKIVAETTELSEQEKEAIFKIMISRASSSTSGLDAINVALNASSLDLTYDIKIRLESVYVMYKTQPNILVKKIDEILNEDKRTESVFEQIISADLQGKITFDNDQSSGDLKPLFIETEKEDEVTKKERNEKIKQLEILEKWYGEIIVVSITQSNTYIEEVGNIETPSGNFISSEYGIPSRKPQTPTKGTTKATVWNTYTLDNRQTTSKPFYQVSSSSQNNILGSGSSKWVVDGGQIIVGISEVPVQTTEYLPKSKAEKDTSTQNKFEYPTLKYDKPSNEIKKMINRNNTSVSVENLLIGKTPVRDNNENNKKNININTNAHVKTVRKTNQTIVLRVTENLSVKENPKISPNISQLENPERPSKIIKQENPKKPSNIIQLENTKVSSNIIKQEKPKKPSNIIQLENTKVSSNIIKQENPKKPSNIIQLENSKKPSNIIQQENPKKPSILIHQENTKVSSNIIKQENTKVLSNKSKPKNPLLQSKPEKKLDQCLDLKKALTQTLATYSVDISSCDDWDGFIKRMAYGMKTSLKRRLRSSQF